MLRLVANCAVVGEPDPERPTVIEAQARIVVADAEREVAQPADLAEVRATRRGCTRSRGRRPGRAEAVAGW